MEPNQLKNAVNDAQKAVEGIEDESLKKIAFQKVLDKLLNNQENNAESVSTKENFHPTETGMEEDISEFIHGKNLKSNTDIVVAIAYFYHFQKDEHFTVNEVKKIYKKVLIPLPKNPTDIINQNIRKGFVSKQDEKKEKKQAFHITRKGIEYVKKGFSSLGVKQKRSKVSNSSNRKPRKTKSPLTNNILSLIKNGFFNKPKNPKEIKEKLEVEGCFYERSIVDEKLRRRFLGKELSRTKIDKKWHYVVKKELE